MIRLDSGYKKEEADEWGGGCCEMGLEGAPDFLFFPQLLQPLNNLGNLLYN